MPEFEEAGIRIINMDCMEAMAEMPDKAFELAIVDVNYGLGMDGGKLGIDGATEAKIYIKKSWDRTPPDRIYFTELFRVSKNQIIWGANHFIDRMPLSSPCWLVWDKDKVGNYFADCELAWTSFGSAVRKVKLAWHGFIQHDMKNKETRIHPTQKPVRLYEWLLKNYAKPGDRILDTHGGSCSLAIACHIMGYKATIYEIDEDYYRAAAERFKRHIRQGVLDF